MQVVNNYASPNFGMALRIKCTKGDLVQLPQSTLNKLGELGKEFKDYKYVDMDIIEGGTPVLNLRGCANAYSSPRAHQDAINREFIALQGEWQGGGQYSLGQTVSDVFNMRSPESAKRLANLHAVDEYENVATFVREFEKRGKAKALEEELARSENKAKEALADNLLGNYGEK